MGAGFAASGIQELVGAVRAVTSEMRVSVSVVALG
jgi:hypothetical protein